jgi:hypothetical protein
MCLACVIPKGKKLPIEYAREGFSRNSHGGGFAYIKDGRVEIKKGFFTFEDFWENFNAIQCNLEGPFLVHFRIATHGKISPFNCHPWRIDDKHALVHNGTFYAFNSAYNIFSDTALFVEQVIKPIFNNNPSVQFNEGFRWTLQKCIGHWNKIAILSADGEFTVFNPGDWRIQGDIWYSNFSYRVPLPPIHHNPNSKSLANIGWGSRNDRTADYHFGKKKYRRGEPKRKNPSYRFKGQYKILTPQEINRLTHEKKKKIKELVGEGLLEKVYDYAEINNSLNIDRKAPDYKDFWLNQAPNTEVENRDSLGFYGWEGLGL